MAASRDEENELPNEIFSAMKDFHHSFGSVEETLEPLLRSSNDELHEKVCFHIFFRQKSTVFTNIKSPTSNVKHSLAFFLSVIKMKSIYFM